MFLIYRLGLNSAVSLITIQVFQIINIKITTICDGYFSLEITISPEGRIKAHSHVNLQPSLHRMLPSHPSRCSCSTVVLPRCRFWHLGASRWHEAIISLSLPGWAAVVLICLFITKALGGGFTASLTGASGGLVQDHVVSALCRQAGATGWQAGALYSDKEG